MTEDMLKYLRPDEREMLERAGKATGPPWLATPDDDAIDEMREDPDLEFEDTVEGVAPGIGMATFLKNPASCHAVHRIEAYDGIYPGDKDWDEARGNLEFAAHARTDLPLLLERLVEARQAVESTLEKYEKAVKLLKRGQKALNRVGWEAGETDDEWLRAASTFVGVYELEKKLGG